MSGSLSQKHGFFSDGWLLLLCQGGYWETSLGLASGSNLGVEREWHVHQTTYYEIFRGSSSTAWTFWAGLPAIWPWHNMLCPRRWQVLNDSFFLVSFFFFSMKWVVELIQAWLLFKSLSEFWHFLWGSQHPFPHVITSFMCNINTFITGLGIQSIKKEKKERKKNAWWHQMVLPLVPLLFRELGEENKGMTLLSGPNLIQGLTEVTSF